MRKLTCAHFFLPILTMPFSLYYSPFLFSPFLPPLTHSLTATSGEPLRLSSHWAPEQLHYYGIHLPLPKADSTGNALHTQQRLHPLQSFSCQPLPWHLWHSQDCWFQPSKTGGDCSGGQQPPVHPWWRTEVRLQHTMDGSRSHYRLEVVQSIWCVVCSPHLCSNCVCLVIHH